MSSSRSPAAVVDEGNAKMAAREWVGWEEEIVLEDDDGEERKVCYYLRCAPPQDGGNSERDLAVVGKYWGPRNIAYSAHSDFLLSLDKAMKACAPAPAPARLAAVAAEVTQLRWKCRKEVMVWLTSLVADPPYGAFGLTCPANHDGGSPASKDTPSTLTLAAAGENKQGFTWICKLPHLDQRRKHYRSFCREGMRISVHDFVYIKSEGRENHVAYVEDMYEDGSAKNMVLARWFDKPDSDHGAVLPPDVHRKEVFFSYGLQDLRVEWVEGLAAVLNSQHFEMFQKSEERSNWQPYLCRRQIDDHKVGPFDMTQLQGYANQEIVRAIVAASSSTAVHAKPPNNKGKAVITGSAPENHGGSSSTVIGDKTMQKRKQKQKPPPCNATPSSSTVIGDKTMEKQKQKVPPCSATPSSTVIGDKTMEKQKQKEMLPPCSTTPSSSTVIGDKTMEKQKQKEMPPPCSATPHSVTNEQTIESSVVPRNVVNSQTTAQNQQPSSGASNAAANDASTMVNPERLFQPGCRLEALSQDSSVRGCWFKCVVLKRREQDNRIRVRYQDVPNAEGTRQLREWLKVTRTAEPDHLGIRLTKRPMIRPQLPTRYRKIESPVAVGVIVDARLHGGWWEGIVLQQETAGHVKVYLQGEGKLVELKVGDLRKSFEWREEQWMPLDARTDVAAKITLDLKKQKGVEQSAMKKGGGSSSKQKAQKKGEQSSQKVAAAAAPAAAPAELAAPSPAGLLQPREEKGDDESAKSAPPRKRFLALELDYSLEEERLQARKNKVPANEPAKPVAEKASLQQSREEGDGMSRGGSSTDAKRCRVDPTNSDSLDCAGRNGKARKSSGVEKMGSAEGSSQEGITASASNGGAAPVNPVPVEEICVTNGEAGVVASDEQEVIDLTMYD